LRAECDEEKGKIGDDSTTVNQGTNNQIDSQRYTVKAWRRDRLKHRNQAKIARKKRLPVLVLSAQDPLPK
jgi:hypothetical protein